MKFTIYGKPCGKGRPRFGQGTVYTDGKTIEYEQRVRCSYLGARGKMHDGGVTISLTAYYPMPKTAKGMLRAEMVGGFVKPLKKPDLDNVIKAILDGLTGCAFQDDVQVTAMQAEKRYGEEPRVEVEICACE